MLAGAGDELQGIKRGIMEMADAIVINKADGDNIQNAKLAKVEYENALHLFPPTESKWNPSVLLCSAKNNEGIQESWEMISRYDFFCKKNGYFNKKRRNQNLQIMHNTLDEKLKESLYLNTKVKELLPKVEKDLLDDKISSYEAANIIFENLKMK